MTPQPSTPSRRPEQPLEPQRGRPVGYPADDLEDAARCKCGHDRTDHGLSSTDRFRCRRPACGCRTYRPPTEETR